jgi:hypothetical protein
MAQIDKWNNEFIGVKSITLKKGTFLNVGQLALSGTVDGTVVGQTTLYTVPAGATFLITHLVIRILDNTGLSGTLAGNIGTNASWNNLMPPTTFTGFNTLGQYYSYPLSGVKVLAGPGDVITFDVTTSNGGVSVLYDVIFFGVIL